MLNEKEFKQLAMLARLNPNDSALISTIKDINSILNYMDLLNEIDIKNFESFENTNETKIESEKNIQTRNDVPINSELSHKEISEFAPKWEAGHFVVPAVITNLTDIE